MRLSLKTAAAAVIVCASTAVIHAQDWAVKKLDASPRHHEYVTLQAGGKPIQAFVVYPEVKNKATAVVLIPEIFGLSAWAKTMADDLAAAGYVVIAPDVLSGMGPNGGGTDSFASMDAVTKAVSGLDNSVVMADLDAAADYIKKVPAANGKLAVTGFCWGGGKSFAFATHRKDLSAAFVFYGPPPSDADMANINVPIYGFYAGNDARIDATIPATITAMKAAGKTYEPVTYDGAGHGFMRAGVDPTNTVEGNKTAREQGFARMKAELAKIDKMPAGKPHAALYSPVPRKKAVADKASAMQCHDMNMSGM
ncbi:dienelactone hydrolase family protein [Terriglobus roseus]|uniref:Carboxymethylenebutenolidase n=1 Tax=Terriglobus roseus TaxID=392734 RepID=A0A1H4TMU8_9BACT|nr:dienelactone hydrolase family protein [Terriglobus roseus]SEC57775.1 carboxymethylenebutenolidase [Terriglobus roseus]